MSGGHGRGGRVRRVLAAAAGAAAARAAAHQCDAAPRQRYLRAQLAHIPRGRQLYS